jgi:hypothetical protein
MMYVITFTSEHGTIYYYRVQRSEHGYQFSLVIDFTKDFIYAHLYSLEEAKIIQKEASERFHLFNLEIYEYIPPTEPRLGKKYDEKEHIIGLLTDMHVAFYPCSHEGKVINMTIDYIKEKT